LRTLTGYSNGIFAIAVCPNGRWLASSGEDHLIRLWDLETGEDTHALAGHTNLVTAIDFAPPEEMGSAGSYLATGSDDQTIKIWDYQTGDSRFAHF
jgi:WD40 repeat protein